MQLLVGHRVPRLCSTVDAFAPMAHVPTVSSESACDARVTLGASEGVVHLAASLTLTDPRN